MVLHAIAISIMIGTIASDWFSKKSVQRRQNTLRWFVAIEKRERWLWFFCDGIPKRSLSLQRNLARANLRSKIASDCYCDRLVH